MLFLFFCWKVLDCFEIWLSEYMWAWQWGEEWHCKCLQLSLLISFTFSLLLLVSSFIHLNPNFISNCLLIRDVIAECRVVIVTVYQWWCGDSNDDDNDDDVLLAMLSYLCCPSLNCCYIGRPSLKHSAWSTSVGVVICTNIILLIYH